MPRTDPRQAVERGRDRRTLFYIPPQPSEWVDGSARRETVVGRLAGADALTNHSIERDDTGEIMVIDGWDDVFGAGRAVTRDLSGRMNGGYASGPGRCKEISEISSMI